MELTTRQCNEWMECKMILADVAPELGAGFVPFCPPEEDEVPVEPIRDALDRLGDEATALTEGDIDAEATWRVAVGFAQLADLLEGGTATSDPG